MRHGLIALGVAIAVGLLHGWLTHATDSALSEDARVATELRCQDRAGSAASDCRELHEKLYLAGALDPERALQAHCTPLRTVEWGRRPAPPALCVERYGGWHHG